MHADFDRVAWDDDGALWLARFNGRLQHALLNMNRHAHPLVSLASDEYWRRVAEG
jgi:hypothetical protein